MGFDVMDYGSDEEIASQTIGGLVGGETVFLFTEGQLEQVKRKSTVPFYYFKNSGGDYTLFPSRCNVVDEQGNIVYNNYYSFAKRYVDKHKGVKKLKLKLEEENVEHFCFDGYKNYE